MMRCMKGDGSEALAGGGRRAAWLAAVSCTLALARPAAGQPSPAPSAPAEALFQAGVEGMRSGRYSSACPKLAESYRLDPLPGALFTLAECEAGWGKVATSVDHYQRFLSALSTLPPERRNKFEERRHLAVDKIKALGPLAAQLVISVPAGVPAALVIKRDGVLVEPSTYGVGRKLDPGEYVLTAELDGVQVWERRIKLAQRDEARVEVPWPLHPSASGTPGAPVPGSSPASPSSSSSSLRAWAYGVGAVGVAGLVTGIVAGSIALGQKGIIDANCPNLLCNAEGHSAVGTARTAGTVSTIGFPVGLAGAVAAVVLFVVSRPRADPSAGSWHGLRPVVIGMDGGAAVAVEGVLR